MFGLFKRKQKEIEIPTRFIGFREQSFIKAVAIESGATEEEVRMLFQIGMISMEEAQ